MEPVTESVELAGARINFLKAGQGDPVLLLHGVPDSSSMWRPIIKDSASSFTCYAPDLPGFGSSEVPADLEFTIDGYGRFVRDFLDALGIQEKVRLVLHDWGGIFGVAFACQYPDRVASIVCGSFPFTSEYRWHAWARVWRTPLLGELSLKLMNKPLFRWETLRSSRGLSDAHIDETYAKLSPLTKNTVLKLYRSASPMNLLAFEERLNRLSELVEIKTYWGGNDIYVDPKYAGFLRPTEQRRIEGVGHWLPVERPDVLTRALLATKV